MTEYQRGLEAAAKKVKELWHHPYADELVAAIRGLSPQPERDCDASQGDLQCPATLPHDDGHLNCRFVAGHGGKHKTVYVNGQEWTQDVSELEPLDWRPKREDSVEVPQPAKQTPKFCGKCRGAQNYAAIATGRYPCPNGCEGWPATPPTPQPELEKLVAAAQEFLKHDGGPGSENYDASKIYQARRAMQSAFEFRCPRCGETLPHLYDENCTDYRRAGVPVEPTPEVLTCSKCRITDSSVKKIGKGNYCSKCWAKIGPKYPPRAKDSFEFYDKIYHPTTGKPPATWEFADAYATYRIELAGVEQPKPKEAK